MAFSSTTGTYSQSGVSQVNKTVNVTLNGSWTITGGDVADYAYSYFNWSDSNGAAYTTGPYNTSYSDYGIRYPIGGLGVSAGTQAYSWIVGDSQAFYLAQSKFACDKNCAFYTEVKFTDCNGFPSDIKFKDGSVVFFKSYAIDATASTPTASSVTSSTATIACSSFFANTDVSSATIWLEYRIFGSGSGYTQAGANQAGSGYSTASISRNLTGLAGSTTYEFRLSMTRTTTNSTTFASTTNTFTTDAAAPTATTVAASAVSSSTATLNGTVDPNTFSTVITFQYGTSSGVYPNETSSAGTFTGDGDQSANIGITSLSSSTLYYFRTKGVWSGGSIFGSELSFTTAANPLIDAASEDHVYLAQYDGTYGVATTVYFTLSSPAATSSDRLVTTAPGTLFVAGDIKVSKDGAAFANVANSVTQLVAANPTYSLALSASEMQAENIIVQIVDQNGPAFRDLFIHVRTKQRLGQQFIDATQLGSNNAALNWTGVGTSPAVLAAGGSTSGGDITATLTNHIIRRNTATAGAAGTITLDASASATNDYYNNTLILILSGTGAGQCRIITDYDGTSKVATVHTSWSTNPAAASIFMIIPGEDVWTWPAPAELSALPTSTGTMRSFLQFLFQRFAYKRTQTVTTQAMFKADDATTLASASVSDNGTTQTSGKMS